MCGPTVRSPFQLLDDPHALLNNALPVLELPKSVAVNSLSATRGSDSDVDSRSSTPRSHGHSQRAEELLDSCGRHVFSSRWEQQQQQRQQHGRTGFSGLSSTISPVASPRSACSTPGGVDQTMGVQLHALVFGAARQHSQQQRRSGSDPGCQAGACASKSRLKSLSSSTGNRANAEQQQQQKQQLLFGSGRHYARGYPHRNRTSHDLRRPSQDSLVSPWTGTGYGSGAYNRGGGAMLSTIAALGLNSSPTGGSAMARGGSISKAKQVLAEAINSVPGLHGLGDFSPATCDTGVLSPLLSIIRQNGCVVSRRSSFSEAASTSSASSGSTACGFASGSSSRGLHAASGQLLGGSGAGRCCSSRLGRCSSAGDAIDEPCIPPTLHEDGPEVDGLSLTAEMMQFKQRQKAAQVQKVVDCIDTVKYLSVDDSNRMALIDLGVVELLLSKMQMSAKSADEVVIASLTALSAICKHDALKQQLWDNPDSAVLLQLLSSRRATAVVKAAHQAVSQLAWSVDSSSTSNGSSFYTSSNCGSVFDSVSSCHVSSTDSNSSTCCGANVLLLTPDQQQQLLATLAAALHPAADVPVLLSSLKLLSKAAGSTDHELPAPPLTPNSFSGCNSSLAAAQQQLRSGWHRVLFSLMPLLIPTHRRQGHLVISAALELLVVLTEKHTDMHQVVSASGCLPPLLAQVLEGNNEQNLQAACILTGLVDCAAVQQQLSQGPALAALLRVLQDQNKSVDVRLAAVHMLKRLAGSVPTVVPLLKLHCAVPVVMALLREVADSDVRRAAAGLLQLLGMPVVVRSRRSTDGNGHGGGRSGQRQHQH